MMMSKVYSWMDWIIMENLPFAFCENRRSRKYSHINGDERPLSRKTLSKYVTLVAKNVLKFQRILTSGP